MARQRDPIPLTGAFRCVVFGKPRSVQTAQGDRLEKSGVEYIRWRKLVAVQVARAVEEQSGGRGFELLNEPVKVRLIWYSPKVHSESDPDVDNMAKPYLDALWAGSRLITDDGLVHDLRILKVGANDPILDLPELDDARRTKEYEETGEFVLLMVDRLDLKNQVTIAAEFLR